MLAVPARTAPLIAKTATKHAIDCFNNFIKYSPLSWTLVRPAMLINLTDR
jgi:hypothetical protein